MTDYPLLPQRIPRWIMMLGAVGLVLFLLMQIVPIFTAASSEDANADSASRVLNRHEAAGQALAFAGKKFGTVTGQPHAVHQSDSMLYGYLSREHQLSAYSQAYDSRFPTDTFQTEVQTSAGKLFVSVHMETGRIAGWKLIASPQDDNKKAGPYISNWTRLQTARKTAVAEGGFRISELKDGEVSGNDVIFHPPGYKIGDAQLTLRVTVDTIGSSIRPAVVSYHAAFVAPSSYTSYIARQEQLASSMSLLGSMLMNAMLFILAIIMSIRARRSTSFRRGIVLTLLFLAIYIANNFNMADGIRASLGARPNLETLTAAGLLISNLFTIAMGLAVWFSLIGGDGMWRRLGKPLWMRFGEPGYGDHVWRSMKLSYPLAFMLLGAQSVLLLGIDRTFGSWSTTSVESSPYNLAFPLLFPLLAWCAAISEEALYRLFGIALFLKLLRRRLPAYLVPTVIWAFGHVTYPVYPAYSRLIELTIVGLLFCWMFVRFGFITAVFTHALLDTILMAFDLLLLGSAVNLLAALFYLALPVGIAWAMRKFANRGRAVSA